MKHTLTTTLITLCTISVCAYGAQAQEPGPIMEILNAAVDISKPTPELLEKLLTKANETEAKIKTIKPNPEKWEEVAFDFLNTDIAYIQQNQPLSEVDNNKMRYVNLLRILNELRRQRESTAFDQATDFRNGPFIGAEDYGPLVGRITLQADGTLRITSKDRREKSGKTHTTILSADGTLSKIPDITITGLTPDGSPIKAPAVEAHGFHPNVAEELMYHLRFTGKKVKEEVMVTGVSIKK